jgi:2-succinyl-5-enolpyruvyl-6-hydroxy-3-cyclohexene-1-carboxylate synthase
MRATLVLRHQQQPKQQQPWLVLLLQQFDAVQLACQLSSPEAAGMRAAAVQHVLCRDQAGQAVYLPSSANRHVNVPPQQKLQQYARPVEAGRPSSYHTTTSRNQSDGRSVTSVTSLLVVQWIWRAGWRGLLLVGQMLAVAGVVSVKRALAVVLRACRSRQ